MHFVYNHCSHTSQFLNGRGHLPRSRSLLKQTNNILYEFVTFDRFQCSSSPISKCSTSQNVYFPPCYFCRQAVFTVWRYVGKGDLHEALQGQKSQTGVDDQLQELARFILRKRNTQHKETKVNIMNYKQICNQGNVFRTSFIHSLTRNEISTGRYVGSKMMKYKK